MGALLQGLRRTLVRRALQGKRGAVLGEEKWVTDEEVQALITAGETSGVRLQATVLQLRHMLLQHRLWEATVRAAVVGVCPT